MKEEELAHLKLIICILFFSATVQMFFSLGLLQGILASSLSVVPSAYSRYILLYFASSISSISLLVFVIQKFEEISCLLMIPVIEY